MVKKRICFLYFAFLLCAAFMCARIYIISTDGSQAQTVLSGQYSRKTDIVSRTGFIFDRSNKLLGTSHRGYAVYVNPALIPQTEINAAAKTLANSSSMAESEHIKLLLKGIPYTFSSQSRIDKPFCKSFKKYKKEGGTFLCHILGYTNADGKGISGLLGAYNDFLTDTRNTASEVFARYQADASGKSFTNGFSEVYVSDYSEREGIYLTVDYDIQKAVEKICDTDKTMQMGAVVVCCADTGEILACVSRPAYDTENVVAYLDSENGELINRAFSGYTPGSVFKIAVTAAALEENPRFFDAEYECTGKITVGDKEIACHKTDGHGKITMKEAFAQSCNPYFINTGISLGTEKILEYAEKLGIRGYDNVNLLKVSPASLPKKNLHLPALCANTSIGQGELLCTPLEICSLVRTAITGNYKKPSIVRSTYDGGIENNIEVYEEHGVLSPHTTEKIRDMMKECVENGTGKKAKPDLFNVAGKTATAQSGQKKNGKEILHSWFAGFFPYENPEYIVCVMCDGNTKNKSAAEIFKEISTALCFENYT